MNTCYADLKIQEKSDSLSKRISLEIKNDNLDKFQLKMILNGCGAVVKPIVKYEEERTILEYEVSNMTNFDKLFSLERNVAEIIDIIIDMIDVIIESKNSYLEYSSFLIDKKFMFYDNINSQIMLIYIPTINSNYPDVLSSIKSELFRESCQSYSQGRYSKLLFVLLNSSTLMGLKYSLINLESNLYDENMSTENTSTKNVSNVNFISEKNERSVKKIDLACKMEKYKDDDKDLDLEKNIKSNSKKEKSSDKKIKKRDSEQVLGKILSIILIAAITSSFLLVALKFELPIIASVIVGFIISLPVTFLVAKLINKSKKNSTKLEDIDKVEFEDANDKMNLVSESKITHLNTKLKNESRTMLISNLHDKYQLVNLQSGEVFNLNFSREDMLSIGRLESSDVYINETSVGRNHLQISKNLHEIYLCDNNSLNGTFLNEIQVKPLKKYQIESGDIIGIGEIKLKFQAS